MINVLLIAQYDGLDKVAAEVQAIVNTDGLDVTLLQSGLTLASLIEFDWTGYKVIWFAAHGDDQGIRIGADMLDVATITPLLQESSAELVFINTCSSERLGEQIYAECQIPVICTVAEADDILAYATGRRFARALVRCEGDYLRAFELSRPGGNRLYRYIPNMYALNRGRKMAQQPPQPELKDQVEALVRALTGDRFSGSPGLVAELASLRKELREYIVKNEEEKSEFRDIIANSHQFRPLQITPLAAIVTTAAIILFISLIFYATYMIIGG